MTISDSARRISLNLLRRRLQITEDLLSVCGASAKSAYKRADKDTAEGRVEFRSLNRYRNLIRKLKARKRKLENTIKELKKL